MTCPHLGGSHGDVRNFTKVKVALPHDITDNDITLNRDIQFVLDEGKGFIFNPGLFFFSQWLTLSHPNQVLLGLGFATLVASQDGFPCIRVQPRTPGVRIAGIMLEISPPLTERFRPKTETKRTTKTATTNITEYTPAVKEDDVWIESTSTTLFLLTNNNFCSDIVPKGYNSLVASALHSLILLKLKHPSL